MSESDVAALRDALHAQQRLLQKLYNELEAEREASASAAKEALSVIRRLEGEKAAVKMEAQQYKRLSEEKICHAEESLTIIEDVIYQKEMEVAALDHQVQAYRYKLLSMGCTDHEVKFQDDLEKFSGEIGGGSMGRRNSAPVPCKYKNLINEGESSSVGESGSRNVDEKRGSDVCDQASDSERKAESSSPGGISSFWDQIRKLDERVKEIAGASSRSESPSSLSSRATSGKSECDLYRKNSLREADLTKSSESRNGAAVDSSCSMSIHDVFEVPEIEENLNCHKVVHPEAVKMESGDEPDWIKKVLQYSHCGNKMLQRSNVSCGLVVVEPRTSVSESGAALNRAVGTSEIVEEVDERPAEASNREEELKLLREIKEKLDLLQQEVRELKVKEKCPTRDEPSLSVLSEAMLHFWL